MFTEEVPSEVKDVPPLNQLAAIGENPQALMDPQRIAGGEVRPLGPQGAVLAGQLLELEAIHESLASAITGCSRLV